MAADGFSLDDKRTPIAESDIPDILACWQNRQNTEFKTSRQARIEELALQLKPLNDERLHLEGEINRLTFEQVLSPTGDGPIAEELQGVKGRLEELQAQLAPLRAEFNQLSRQFWVSKEQVKTNKFDLSASRYRNVIGDEIFCERSEVTLKRLAILNEIMNAEIESLGKIL